MRKIARLGLVAIIVVCVFFVSTWIFRSLAASREYSIAEKRIEVALGESLNHLDFSDLKNLQAMPGTISQMVKLTNLNINDTRITDLRPVSSLPVIEYLTFRRSRVFDLAPLGRIASLKVLDIGETRVFDLEPLVRIESLERLDIGGTAIKSLEPATRMAKLNWINLWKSYAYDGSAIHYKTLKTRFADVFNGTAYQQNYVPGSLYRRKVRLKRFVDDWSPF